MIDVSRDFVGGVSFVLSQELAKFRIHRSCESGDITFFICHVTTISKCHVTLRMGSSLSSHQLAKFEFHKLCESKDRKLFDLSGDYVVDVSCDFVDEISSSYATTLLSLGSVGLVKVEILRF